MKNNSRSSMLGRLILALTFCFSMFAHAAPKPLSPGNDGVEPIVVPLAVQPVQMEMEAAPPLQKKASYSVGFSSWLPRNLNIASVAPAPDFTQVDFPEVSLNVLSQWNFLERLTSRMQAHGEWLVGAAYEQLQRSGPGGSQVLHLSSLRVGAGARWVLLGGTLQPQVQVAVLPTWMTSQGSVLAPDGLSATGLLAEASGLALYSPGFLRGAADGDGGVGLGLHQTLGRINGNDMSGLGYDLILRQSF